MIGVDGVAEQPSECVGFLICQIGFHINEFALPCVVAAQQRTDPMSAALGITPSDGDECRINVDATIAR
jgi:hypothetical protein